MHRKRVPTPFSKEAGLRVSKVRRERGLSREDLANLSGISTQTLKRLEKGKHVMLYCYEEIACALDVPASYFFGCTLNPEEADQFSPRAYQFSRADIFRFLEEHRLENDGK